MMMIESKDDNTIGRASSSSSSSGSNYLSSTMIDSLMGTWTFQKTMVSSHYYDVQAYVVIHLMPDPTQQLGCHLTKCNELKNQICQRDNGDDDDDDGSSDKTRATTTCVHTTSNIVEWSDVSMLMQFGYEVKDGYVWTTNIVQNTSDWFGPYNILMAHKPSKKVNNSTTIPGSYTSRYVQTVTTSQLKYPSDCSLISNSKFDRYGGYKAVQNTISKQVATNIDFDDSTIDPYANYTCPSKNKNDDDNDNNKSEDWSPLLPRIELFANTKDPHNKVDLKLNFDLFSFPTSKADPMYTVWPALIKHFDNHDIRGPYCWNTDNNDDDEVEDHEYMMNHTASSSSFLRLRRHLGSDSGDSTTLDKKKKKTTDDSFIHGYSIPLRFDTRLDDNSWTMTKGCVDGLPCWHTGGGGGGVIPSDDSGGNDNPGTFVQFLLTYGIYILAVGLLISMIGNCQLCWKLRQHRRRQQHPEDPPNNYNNTNNDAPVSLDIGASNVEESLRERLLTGETQQESQQSQTQEENPAVNAPAVASSNR